MAIKSHIQLPRFILQNFRDEKDSEKKVWYLDLSSCEINRKSASRLGTSKGYYSEDGEEFWSKNVESPFSEFAHEINLFCSNKLQALQMNSKKTEIARHYIKAAVVRSTSAYEEMMNSSFSAPLYTEQQRHDILSVLGMRNTEILDPILSAQHVTVLANRSNRHLVVPRNCFYLVSHEHNPVYIAPISPRAALLLFSPENSSLSRDSYAEVFDDKEIDWLNICALKNERIYNMDFVACDRRTELEFLQYILQESHRKSEIMHTHDP